MTLNDTTVARIPPVTSFEVRVAKESFKFNAAHFVAFKGFRERLHGHNYLVGVRLLGSRKISHDGYCIDFGEVKAVTKKICKDLNEHFLCPALSDVIKVVVEKNKKGDEYVTLDCEDGSNFRFPRGDCAMLPIVHATAEELAIYLYGKILGDLDAEYLLARGIHTMEITVAEAVGQEALFRLEIPKEQEEFNVASFIMGKGVQPTPCPSAPGSENILTKVPVNSCNDGCASCQEKFSAKLQSLADAINAGAFHPNGSSKQISLKDLETHVTAGTTK